MENEKTEQEKPQEQQASQAEQPAEQKPDIYEQMKTLSVQQPWASAICSGVKDVENRTWQPKETVCRIQFIPVRKRCQKILAQRTSGKK